MSVDFGDVFTTMRPLTICRPPAKRSIDETSALRQQTLVIVVCASSALTCAVIAMKVRLLQPADVVFETLYAVSIICLKEAVNWTES